jgi:hypothetical protein
MDDVADLTQVVFRVPWDPSPASRVADERGHRWSLVAPTPWPAFRLPPTDRGGYLPLRGLARS